MTLNLKHRGEIHQKAGKKMNSKDLGGLAPESTLLDLLVCNVHVKSYYLESSARRKSGRNRCLGIKETNETSFFSFSFFEVELKNRRGKSLLSRKCEIE